MVEIRCFDIKTFPEIEFQRILETVPDFMHKEICKYVFTIDRIRCLIGKLMVLEDYLNDGYSKHDFQTNWYRDQHNKPHLSNWKSFNISHSGDYVVYASCKDKKTLGIDIELMSLTLDTAGMLSLFCEEEQTAIRKSEDERNSAFFDIWTRKEALLKATGIGIVDGLDKCNCLDKSIQWKGKNWSIFSLDFRDPHYKLSIAFEGEGETFRYSISPFNLMC